MVLKKEEILDIYSSQELLNKQYEPIEFCLENISLKRQTIRLFGGSIHPPITQISTSSTQNNFTNLIERDYDRITFNEANGFVYMYDQTTGAVVKVNPTTGAKTTPFGAGGGAVGDVAYHSNNGLLYRVSSGSIVITVTDSNDNIVTTISVAIGVTGILGVLSVPERNEIWVVSTTGAFNIIHRINTTTNLTNLEVALLPVGLGFSDLAYNSNNDFIYVSSSSAPTSIIRVHPSTVAQTIIPLGGVQAIRRMIYNPDDTNIYVQRTSDINTVDVNDNVTTISAPFASQTTGIFGMYYNADDGFIYVGDAVNNNQFFAWDWNTNTIVDTVVTNTDGGTRVARDLITDAAGNLYVCFFGNAAAGGQLSVVTPLSSVVQTVGGSTVDFEEKIREVQFNPIRTKKFKLIASRTSQFANLVKYKKVSTSGKTHEESYNPQDYVSAMNSDRVVIEFPDMDGLIFDGTKFLEFDLDSKETICLYFYKEQYLIGSVLQNPYLMNPDEVCFMNDNDSFFDGDPKKKRICLN